MLPQDWHLILLHADWYPQKNHGLSIHLPAGGQLSGLQALVVVNKAMTNVQGQAFVWT